MARVHHNPLARKEGISYHLTSIRIRIAIISRSATSLAHQFYPKWVIGLRLPTQHQPPSFLMVPWKMTITEAQTHCALGQYGGQKHKHEREKMGSEGFAGLAHSPPQALPTNGVVDPLLA